MYLHSIEKMELSQLARLFVYQALELVDVCAATTSKHAQRAIVHHSRSPDIVLDFK